MAEKQPKGRRKGRNTAASAQSAVGPAVSRKRLSGKSARAKILESAFVVDAADLTELGQEMDAIGSALLAVLAREEEAETFDIDSSSKSRQSGDGSRHAGEVAWARRTLARLANDPRYEAVGPLFQLIEGTIDSGDLLEAEDLAAEVLNRVWRRSQEYDVGKNAFLQRIRAKEFKTLNDVEPLTVDRGEALARIMQSDKSELEAMARNPDRPKELVIKLDGEFDVIRLVKA